MKLSKSKDDGKQKGPPETVSSGVICFFQRNLWNSALKFALCELTLAPLPCLLLSHGYSPPTHPFEVQFAPHSSDTSLPITNDFHFL